MIIASATGDDGRKLYMLGISRENVTRLVAGFPIRVTAESHPGFPEDLSILICFGETERTIAEAMHGLIGPETKVITVPREKGGVS